MHGFYREGKSGQGPSCKHSSVCVLCVCGEIRWAPRKRSHLLLTKFPLVSSNWVPQHTRHRFSLALRKWESAKRKGRRREGKRGGGWNSPVQGAPASCRPGDGPDIASPLSSEKKRQKDKGLVNMLVFTTLYRSKAEICMGLPIIQRKSLKSPNNKQEHDASPHQ